MARGRGLSTSRVGSGTTPSTSPSSRCPLSGKPGEKMAAGGGCAVFLVQWHCGHRKGLQADGCSLIGGWVGWEFQRTNAEDRSLSLLNSCLSNLQVKLAPPPPTPLRYTHTHTHGTPACRRPRVVSALNVLYCPPSWVICKPRCCGCLSLFCLLRRSLSIYLSIYLFISLSLSFSLPLALVITFISISLFRGSLWCLVVVQIR